MCFYYCCSCGSDHVYFILILSIMSRPHRAVLPVLIQDGALLTSLIVGPGIHIAEVVSATRLTVHMDIYGSVLVVYPILMVVRLSV